MSKFNPERLSVEFRQGVTATDPITPRRYTLTHSDTTADLFLTIGINYAYDKLGPMRDEVFGQWIFNGYGYLYEVYVFLDSYDNLSSTSIRNDVFRRELPLALEAIRYGDRRFFAAHAFLNNAPIIVNFISASPEFNRIECWGSFSDYDSIGSTKQKEKS